MGNNYILHTRKVGRPIDAAKTADADLAADERLTLPVIKGLTYEFEASLISEAHATPDIKFGFSLPAGSTGQMFNEAAPATSVALNAAVNVDGTGNPVLTKLRGSFVAGADGHIALTWAQQTSNANESKLLAGSTLTVTNLN